MKVHELIAALELDSDENGMADGIARAVKFDMGSAIDVWNMAAMSSDGNVKPPFPISFFEMQNGSETYSFLYMEGIEEDFVFAFSNSPSSSWMQEDLMIRVDRGVEGDAFVAQVSTLSDEPGKSYKIIREVDALCDDGELWGAVSREGCIAFLAKALMVSMAIFACSNIEYIDHPPPKFINAKRKKKGKTPFFSYKTLHIKTGDKKTVSTGDGGGSHESPRLHLRRGHIRRLQSGNKIWVQSCMVGDASKGAVDKDYKVSVN